MAGAVAPTVVGLYYQIVDKDEPDVTVVRYLDNYHVCQRKPMEPHLKQIVADTGDALLARLIAGELQRLLDSTHVRQDVATRRPARKHR